MISGDQPARLREVDADRLPSCTKQHLSDRHSTITPSAGLADLAGPSVPGRLPDQGQQRGYTTVTDPEVQPQSHLDALIVKYARGRAIKEIERQNDLQEGALGSHLKPSQRGRFPRLHVQQRFAAALGAPLKEVSNAFAADSQMGLLQTDPLPPHAKALIDDYLALDDSRRALAAQIVRAILQQQTTEHSGSDLGHIRATVAGSTTRGTVDNAVAPSPRDRGTTTRQRDRRTGAPDDHPTATPETTTWGA